MNGIWHLSTILMALLCVTAPAAANEANFLKSLQGQWTGGGPVRIRVNWSPITVSCNFDTQADNNTLTMKGTCRGLMFMSRSISADIRYRDAGYSGWYIGPKGGRARVNGSRVGNAIDLIIHWPKTINGDRIADLTVQKIGSNGMKLMTVDVDPKSGKPVVTSDLNLTRK